MNRGTVTPVLLMANTIVGLGGFKDKAKGKHTWKVECKGLATGIHQAYCKGRALELYAGKSPLWKTELGSRNDMSSPVQHVHRPGRVLLRS